MDNRAVCIRLKKLEIRASSSVGGTVETNQKYSDAYSRLLL